MSQKLPQSFLLPSFLFPLVCWLREELNRPLDCRIVSKDAEDVALRVRHLRVLDGLNSLCHIDSKTGVEEGLIWLATTLNIDLVELCSSRTDRDSRSDRFWQRELDTIRDGQGRCRTKRSTMMADVASHEDKRVWVRRCAGKACQVADVVARRVQEIETTISEEVVCPKFADCKGCALIREVYLTHRSASEFK